LLLQATRDVAADAAAALARLEAVDANRQAITAAELAVLGQAIAADEEAAHEVRAWAPAGAQYCRDHMLFLDGGAGQQHAFDKVCQLLC
jgi:hypothetical protein